MTLYRILFLVMAFLVFGAEAGLSAPGDVTVRRTGNSEAYKAAVFPHWVHVIRFRCYACHPAPFKMVTFKLQTGILKQDRGPYKEQDETAKPDAKSDGEEAVPKATSEEKSEGQPAPDAVPVVAVEKAGESVEKITKPTEKAEDSTGENQVMHGEQACGMCHNGKTAFLVEFKTCGKCHSK